MAKQRIFLIGAIILFIFLVLWFIIGCPPFKKCPGTRLSTGPPPPRVILKIVGPWDSEKDWEEIADKFNEYKINDQNEPLDVIVEYETISDQTNYENAVKEMQFEGDGPNIYMLFNSWIPRYKEKLLPLPKEIMSLAQFENTFANVAVDDLTTPDGIIYALPFYIDTPALYYNKDRFFNEGFFRAPETWDEFKNYVERLTIFDKNGNIEKAGAAFGGGSNVNRSQDIIILLAMQNNFGKDDLASLVSFENPGSIAAIKFYTDFADPIKRFYTWNEDWMFSIDAFTQRKTAMMINYSHHLDNVISKTGDTLNFTIAPMPQLDKNYKVNYASYWVPVVPKIAPCRSAAKKTDCYGLAWEFLNFAASKENVKLYLDSTNRAAANLQLAQEQASDFDDARSVFAGQVFTAKSWDHPNDKKSDMVLIEMINSMITKDYNKKKTMQEAIDIAKAEIKSLN
ncbi:MAG: extracellular solute-binding protein [Candidatus Pacebacteria bacterium]|nr:extracellular solute-binding protein [Candidatus Paceibacterota bacterium]